MKHLAISLRVFLFLTVVTGLLYPIAITALGQMIFPWKANGSLITKNNKVIGSVLIGQNFNRDDYFSSRPSATYYSTLPSGGSNLSVTQEKLKSASRMAMDSFVIRNTLKAGRIIPSEMCYSSASGVDPHISPESAKLQLERVVMANHFNAYKKKQLLDSLYKFTTLKPVFYPGEAVVNVFMLNLAVERIK